MRGLKGTGRSFTGLKPVRAKLFSSAFATNGVANTAYGAITNVTTANFSEFTSFEAVYDEMRVLAVVFHWMPYLSVASSAPVTVTASVEFDPTAGAPSAIYQPLEGSFSAGPYFLTSASSGTVNEPTVRKYFQIHADPPAPLAPITGSDVPGKSWFAMDTGTPVNLFTWQMCTTTPTGGGVVSGTYLHELHVEFRLRT
jgi:hypothetical protein